MSVPKPTYEDEITSAQDILRTRIGITNFSEGSASSVIVSLMAENQMRLYALLTQAENARNIDVSSGSDLDNLGRGFGITRVIATTAGADAGTEQLLVTNNSPTLTLNFPARTAIWNPGNPNLRYYTNALISVLPGSASAVAVQSTRPGEYSNIGVGALTAHNGPQQFSVTNFLPIRGGSNTESDQAFRYRISQTLKSAIIGGPMSAQGVTNALIALPGVLDVILFPGQGKLDALIVPTDDYRPDDDFLSTVETEMKRVCAVGVAVRAMPPTVVGIDVDIALSVSGSSLAPQSPLRSLMQNVVKGYINTRRVFIAQGTSMGPGTTDPLETSIQYQILQAALIDAARASLGDRLLGITILLSLGVGKHSLQGNIYPRNGEVLRSRAVRVTTTAG